MEAGFTKTRKKQNPESNFRTESLSKNRLIGDIKMEVVSFSI